MNLDDATSRLVPLPDGRIHLVEQGQGPAVLLIHGFPESWYSWRHQLPALAAAGYRAIAIDVRGYGGSVRPAAIEEYRMLRLVADNVELLTELGIADAVLIGHDWGSPIAANTALLRPDLVRAVGLLSVPYTPRSGPRPTEVFRHLAASRSDGAEFYVNYFQRPGRAEAEIEADPTTWLRGLYAALSGGPTAAGTEVFYIKPGHRMADQFPAGELPSWLSEADLAFLVRQFQLSGFAGPLHRYRNMDRDWEDLAAWTHRPIQQPSVFIAGADDGPVRWSRAAIDNYPRTLPGVRGVHLLDGVGHWVQQEQPARVNQILLDWLAEL